MSCLQAACYFSLILIGFCFLVNIWWWWLTMSCEEPQYLFPLSQVMLCSSTYSLCSLFMVMRVATLPLSSFVLLVSLFPFPKGFISIHFHFHSPYLPSYWQVAPRHAVWLVSAILIICLTEDLFDLWTATHIWHFFKLLFIWLAVI
jgi:hypothetical protein